jgi:hypothetical protein
MTLIKELIGYFDGKGYIIGYFIWFITIIIIIKIDNIQRRRLNEKRGE